MPYTIHRAAERGKADHGWLRTRFSFSFAEYHNRSRMGFGALRVINDDIVQAGMGFGMHPHKEMEIISIITQGALEHKDSEGHHAITKEGEIQYMSAGTGIWHSEYATAEADAALFQIWIRPNINNLPPVYDNRDFSQIDQHNRWALLVSGDGREGSMKIRQDAAIYSSMLDAGHQLMLPEQAESHGFLLFVMEGEITVAEEVLHARDEIQLLEGKGWIIEAQQEAKLLLFDMPLSR